MQSLLFARALMGLSLAFHILYTAMGVSLPLMLLVAEGLSLLKKDEVYHQIARRWIRTAALLFAIGAVSGTILSFELGFLWPNFMGFAGSLIGIAFSLEGFAFFSEAIFLGLYLYGEKRLSRFALFLTTIPMSIAAAISAVFVISANGWMNSPSGFTLSGGQLANVEPFRAMANPAWAHEAIHGTLSSYVAASFAVVGVYAAALLKGHRTRYNQQAFSLALAFAMVFLPLMLITGDYSARVVAQTQLPKFAAMEAIFETTSGAPLTIGGWPDIESGEVKYGIAIPKMLSWLGYRDVNAVVKGLNDFPAGTTPDPRPVHVSFQLMVGSFFLMLLPLFWYGLLRIRRQDPWSSRPFLWSALLASPIGFLALEAGWMVTEFGRQPWVAVGYMKLSEGVTPRTGIEIVFLVFLAVYIALTAGLVWLLLLGKTAPPSQEMEAGARKETHGSL